MLGVMKLKGEGVERDFAGALPLIRRAADLGLGTAQAQLAMLDSAAAGYLDANGPIIEHRRGHKQGRTGDAGGGEGGGGTRGGEGGERTGAGDAEDRKKRPKRPD